MNESKTNESNEIKEPGWNLENTYAGLPKMFYSLLNPTPVGAPELIVFNSPLAASLGLSVQALQNKDGVAVLAGNRMPEGSLPLAQAYAGHQFGHFTMLGDGRAILLGEQITPSGERVDIQLKGSGITPYSRGGDGRATLGPMLREYIISEAMHALGIATTRGLAVVTTGEPVMRETRLPGAVLTRTSAGHIRVGTFEYAARFGTPADLRALVDYTLQRHFPSGDPTKNPYLFLLEQVIKRQAELIAKWQLVGFIHGVMNTDNMAISGETIDYGPCAFMDGYDPATVFSSIDHQGRYAYGNQPHIAVWNLSRFAETLLPLLHEDGDRAVELARNAVTGFRDLYQTHFLAGMRAKLGLFNEEPQDEALIEELLGLMHQSHADYTNTFRALTFEKMDDTALFGLVEFAKWKAQWQDRLSGQPQSKEASHQLMQSSNPAIIPRNHRVEEALEAAVKHGDYGVMTRLLQVLSNPFAHSPEQDDYTSLPPQSTRPYQTFCGT